MRTNKTAEIKEAAAETWGCVLWLLGLAILMTPVWMMIYF
jgi:hypothetical protein